MSDYGSDLYETFSLQTKRKNLYNTDIQNRRSIKDPKDSNCVLIVLKKKIKDSQRDSMRMEEKSVEMNVLLLAFTLVDLTASLKM